MTILRLAQANEALDTKPTTTWWMAQCECGTVKPIRGGNVSEYNAKNLGCGCRVALGQGTFAAPEYQRKNGHKWPKGQPQQRRTNAGDSAKRLAFGQYKKGASDRGYTWALSFEDFLRLTSSSCHYCGDLWSIETGKNTKGLNGTYKRNGIDRQDNSIGYVLDNCVSCCWPCNALKRAQNEKVWLAGITQTAAHLLRIAAHQEQIALAKEVIS